MDIEILALQKLLNEKLDKKLIEDGKYGPDTSAAVKDYLDENSDRNSMEIFEPRTEHFSLKEFYSNAVVGGEKMAKAIKPPEKYFDNIQRNMDRLEELRHVLGGTPILITSGYRTNEYNKYINGAKNSAHLRGSAADIMVRGIPPREVYLAADKIYCDGGVGLYKDFVHVDLDTEVNRPARW